MRTPMLAVVLLGSHGRVHVDVGWTIRRFRIVVTTNERPRCGQSSAIGRAACPSVSRSVTPSDQARLDQAKFEPVKTSPGREYARLVDEVHVNDKLRRG
jgi:hypothetical protein